MGPGEIHLASFPYGGTPGRKVRPVLLLTGIVGPVPEVLVAYITSVVPATPLTTDLVIDPQDPEHISTNLRTLSAVRLRKLATLHRSDFVRSLGLLSRGSWTEVESKLRLLLNLP